MYTELTFVQKMSTHKSNIGLRLNGIANDGNFFTTDSPHLQTTVGYHCLKLSQNPDTNTLNNRNVLSMDCYASEGDTYLPVS